MDFTYDAYKDLIFKLKENGYKFADYHNWESYEKVVIMRHDIDNSIEKALEMAEIERVVGIKSTYFVLLTGEFYNIFSRSAKKMLMDIKKMGHNIGLHFDETVYDSECRGGILYNIVFECEILSKILGERVAAVSMHRPSKTTLKFDLKICNGSVVNTYDDIFFQQFKYLSDSRRHWRENVNEIVELPEKYPRLQILTHAFWYHREDWSLQKTVELFIREGALDRYDKLDHNFTDLHSVLERGLFC